MTRKELTILIGTCNRLPLLKKCLASIVDKVSCSYEIIIADAGDCKETTNYIKKMAKKYDISLIEDKSKDGQANIFNQILPSIKSKYICWLSDDNTFRNDMLDKAVLILEKNKSIGLIGLKVKDVFGKYMFEPYIGGIWPSGVLNVNQGIIRSELLHYMDFFDKEFPDYGIDANLTTRVLLSGYKVAYTRKIAVNHYRDHITYPGVFLDNSRKKRLKKALKIYQKKYNNLCLDYRRKRKSLSFKIFHSLYILIRIIYATFAVFGVGLDSRIGFVERDWKNCFEGEFISLLDLVYNRRKDYYLVQTVQPKHIKKFKYVKN